MKLREYAVVPRVRRVSTSCLARSSPSRCGNRGCVRYHLPMHFPSPPVLLSLPSCPALSCFLVSERGAGRGRSGRTGDTRLLRRRRRRSRVAVDRRWRRERARWARDHGAGGVLRPSAADGRSDPDRGQPRGPRHRSDAGRYRGGLELVPAAGRRSRRTGQRLRRGARGPDPVERSPGSGSAGGFAAVARRRRGEGPRRRRLRSRLADATGVFERRHRARPRQPPAPPASCPRPTACRPSPGPSSSTSARRRAGERRVPGGPRRRQPRRQTALGHGGRPQPLDRRMDPPRRTGLVRCRRSS